MADNQSRNDEQNRNMGRQGTEDEAARSGQQTPGRNPSDDRSTNQRQGGGNEPRRDDELDEGTGGQQRNQGGQRG